jgi:hypothetical protein
MLFIRYFRTSQGTTLAMIWFNWRSFANLAIAGGGVRGKTRQNWAARRNGASIANNTIAAQVAAASVSVCMRFCSWLYPRIEYVEFHHRLAGQITGIIIISGHVHELRKNLPLPQQQSFPGSGLTQLISIIKNLIKCILYHGFSKCNCGTTWCSYG